MRRPQIRHSGRQGQGPFRHRRCRRRVRAGQDRFPPDGQKKSIPFEKLLQAVALGNTEPEVISSIAVRLARMNTRWKMTTR